MKPIITIFEFIFDDMYVPEFPNNIKIRLALSKRIRMQQFLFNGANLILIYYEESLVCIIKFEFKTISFS